MNWMLMLKGAIGFLVIVTVTYFFQKGQTYWAAFVVSMPWNTMVAFTILGFDPKRTPAKAAELGSRTAVGLLVTALFGVTLALALKKLEFWPAFGVALLVLAAAHAGFRILILKGMV